MKVTKETLEQVSHYFNRLQDILSPPLPEGFLKKLTIMFGGDGKGKQTIMFFSSSKEIQKAILRVSDETGWLDMDALAEALGENNYFLALLVDDLATLIPAARLYKSTYPAEYCKTVSINDFLHGFMICLEEFNDNWCTNVAGQVFQPI